MLKTIIGILSVILTIGYLLSGVQLVGDISWSGTGVSWFFIGMAVFTAIWFLFLRKLHFFSTFEHEFTHLLVGLIFLKKPSRFVATETSGGVTSMFAGNFLITLAPYFLPTFVFLILPLYFVLKLEVLPYYYGFIGFLTAYHILSTIREFCYDQPDIQKSGKLFSTVFLIFSNLVCYGIILAFVSGGFKLAGSFLAGGVMELVDLVKAVI